MNEYELFKDADLSTYFFIVVNPLSGGNAASILLHTGFNYFQFRLNSSIPSTDETHHNSSDIQHPATEHGGGNAQRLVTLPLIKVFVSDIRNGTTGNKDVFHIIRAISLLKERHKPTCPPGWDSRVRVMVAGGDGTAMWTFSELQRHKVDSSLVLVGVVPFGTGNDFANATGSHLTIKLPNEDPKAMIRRLVAHWITFVAADFDLWKVRVELYSGGSFAKVDSKTRKKNCNSRTVSRRNTSCDHSRVGHGKLLQRWCGITYWRGVRSKQEGQCNIEQGSVCAGRREEDPFSSAALNRQHCRRSLCKANGN
eukprot:Gregarina_sp_Poly_1__6231@NODE_3300_length_1203_cov_117_061620_g1032_i2_p1_GENE_NODE_3300_length_1203_cov_117_061620_g1032_i2NODE_3300_length_1203_cov_117_061620_g1032_i2_p1_ORF_typecomplete_len310_score20_64DAGK_cat/PF00781_24/3_2e16Alfin/PF12165_8/0_071_NODE_3300_length_1203_cov_117_061620_g1032_i21601089